MLATLHSTPHESSPRPVAAASTQDGMLWNNFRNGSQTALSQLYKMHEQHLYDYGIATCRDHDLVMDCLQELFSRLWSTRKNVADANCVRVYLFKSFQRLLMHQIVWKRKSQSSKGHPGELIPPFEQTLIDREQRSEQIKKLKQGIESLSKGQREVILLKFFNELSYPEISEIMEMQVDSVYNLASKAIDVLRKKVRIDDLLVPS